MKRKILSILLVVSLFCGQTVFAAEGMMPSEAGETAAATELLETIEPTQPTEAPTEAILTENPTVPEPETELPTEPVTEPVPEPTVAPTIEPKPEPTTEPTTAPTSEPATEPTTQPPTEPEPPQFPTALQIDSRHLFEGMDSTYEEGYRPRIQNGEVRILVPLLPTGVLQNNEIYASVDVGQGSVPFVIANYEKVVPLSRVSTSDGSEIVELYLAEFRIPLKESRKNGTYPVKLKFSGYDVNAKEVKLEYMVFVTVTDEVVEIPEPVQSPKAPAVYGPPKPTAEPIVYISESLLEPGTAIAGEPFTLTLTLKNSVTTKDVKNMLVTVDLDNLQINLLEKSTVIPVDSLKAGQEIQLPLHFSTDPNIQEGKHTVKFHFTYDSSSTLKLSSEGSVIVDVRQPAELSYDGAVLPAKVFQDDTVGISLNLMNTGKSPLYNCRIDCNVEGLHSGGTIFVGEIPAGENKMGRGNLRVSKEILGDVKGTILISYEDAFGTDFRKEVEVTTLIDPKPQPPEEEKEKNPSYWWAFGLAGIAVGALGSFGIPWLIRDRKQRKEDDLRL